MATKMVPKMVPMMFLVGPSGVVIRCFLGSCTQIIRSLGQPGDRMTADGSRDMRTKHTNTHTAIFCHRSL